MTDNEPANNAACEQLERADLMTNLPWKMDLRSALLLLQHNASAALNLRENEALAEELQALPEETANAYQRRL